MTTSDVVVQKDVGVEVTKSELSIFLGCLKYNTTPPPKLEHALK